MTDPTKARGLFARAGELDAAGREAEAAPLYEQAFAAGLAGDDLRRGLVQYGSTLRNLGRYDEAVSVLRRAGTEFPGSASVRVFLALALTSAGHGPEAVRTLITLALDQIGDDDLQYYRRALREYAAALAG
jgi:tetratricopeptide (TPR) repeat protein